LGVQESEVNQVSPRTGRPPKGEGTRSLKINIRISEREAQKIQYCAARLGTTRTDAIVKGIELLEAELDKK